MMILKNPIFHMWNISVVFLFFLAKNNIFFCEKNGIGLPIWLIFPVWLSVLQIIGSISNFESVLDLVLSSIGGIAWFGPIFKILL
jgi:hypothetical protein